ncbi:MAG: hypothetical protein RJP96_14830 [Algiphilus sp.]|uniref:hypothetical protein n=1 Tax=Algiphilus sp. TaxID=1872431 RepID=UPI0032EE371A
MHKECPKCSYVRTDADPPPITDCPSCGIVYAKFEALQQEGPAPSPAPRVTVNRAAELRAKASRTHICTACGHAGSERTITRGSLAIEIILWLFFIVPGLIYSLWRMTSRYHVCPKCRHAAMIPADTPRGRQLAQEYNARD